MNVYEIDSYETFYHKLYFMKPDVFYKYLVELNDTPKVSINGICKEYKKYMRHKRNSAFAFYVYKLDPTTQKYLYNVMCSFSYNRNMWFFYNFDMWTLYNIGVFFGKMQEYLFDVEFKFPKALRKKLPKVLVSIINEYVPQHFINLYKTFDNHQKKTLVNWYNTYFS